jgi:hypothetical protein
MVEGNLEIDRTMRKGLGLCKICGKRPYWCTCLYPQFTGDDDTNRPVGHIILAGTDGDDYSVLDKVDPRIKVIATSGVPLNHEERLIAKQLSFGISFVEERKTHNIQVASEETIEAAHGEATKILTPENKHWLLRNMGFKGRGKGKWKHILFEEEIEFDLQTDTLVQLAFQIHKTGYKNAHTEWTSQQKTGTV